MEGEEDYFGYTSINKILPTKKFTIYSYIITSRHILAAHQNTNYNIIHDYTLAVSLIGPISSPPLVYFVDLSYHNWSTLSTRVFDAKKARRWAHRHRQEAVRPVRRQHPGGKYLGPDHDPAPQRPDLRPDPAGIRRLGPDRSARLPVGGSHRGGPHHGHRPVPAVAGHRSAGGLWRGRAAPV